MWGRNVLRPWQGRLMCLPFLSPADSADIEGYSKFSHTHFTSRQTPTAIARRSAYRNMLSKKMHNILSHAHRKVGSIGLSFHDTDLFPFACTVETSHRGISFCISTELFFFTFITGRKLQPVCLHYVGEECFFVVNCATLTACFLYL